MKEGERQGGREWGQRQRENQVSARLIAEFLGRISIATDCVAKLQADSQHSERAAMATAG